MDCSSHWILNAQTGGRRRVFLVNTKTTPNLRLETIPGTLSVPVWLYGCPRCFNDTAAEFQSFPGKQQDKQQKIWFQQEDIYWPVMGCRTWSNRWYISNSLIYQCIWYILWYIGKLQTSTQNKERYCSNRNNLIICYKNDFDYSHYPSWVKTKIQN